MSGPHPRYELDSTEQAILDVLKREGRATPLLIRQDIDVRKEYVSEALRQLVKAGLVSKVNRGLYEYAGDGRVTLDDDEIAELCDILGRCDVAGAGVWCERLQEASDA